MPCVLLNKGARHTNRHSINRPKCSTLPVRSTVHEHPQVFHPACGKHHAMSTSECIKMKKEVNARILPSLLPGCGDDVASCLPFPWPSLFLFTVMAVPSRGEPKASCECLLKGVCESCGSSHVGACTASRTQDLKMSLGVMGT